MAVAAPPRAPRRVAKRESLASWRWGDRIAYVSCWAAGLALCLIAFGIVAFMAVKGVQYLLGFALPNFYFHVTTAYAILRHNGVELGKPDFLGGN